MEKTALMLHREFSDGLTDLINGCGLPPFVIKDTLRNALLQIENLVEAQYQKDLTEFEREKLSEDKNEE